MSGSDDVYVLRADDLSAVIDNRNSSDIRMLLASEGVFVAGRKDFLSPYVDRFAFNSSWYSSACTGLFRVGGGEKFAGYRSTAQMDEIAERLEHIYISNAGRIEDAKILNRTTSGDAHTVTVEYIQRYPSKSAVLRRERRSFNFQMDEGDSGHLEFTTVVTDEKDIRALGVVLAAVHRQTEGELIPYALEKLTIQGRVNLFDEMMEDGLEWSVEDTLGLSVHNGTELTGNQLQLLRRAVLEGQNLRGHELVEKLVAEGHYFSSGRLLLELTGHPIEVTVDIAFKNRPKSVVVSAAKSRLTDGDGEVETAIVHSILRKVWTKVHDEFDKIRAEEEAQSKSADET